MTEDSEYTLGANGPKNRVFGLIGNGARQEYAVDANRAEDLRCLAAKCVYGSEDDAAEAYAALDGELQTLKMHVPYFFKWLGKLGERADKRKIRRALERAIDNMCRQEGRVLDSERHKPAGD